MPGITAGLDLLLGMGAGGGPWGPQATGLMPAALGRKPHKPSGQIPCQQLLSYSSRKLLGVKTRHATVDMRESYI